MLPTPRVAHVELPDLVLQVALPHANGDALLVASALEPGQVLTCCPQARAVGITPGTSLYAARQHLPGAKVVTADEAAYHAIHAGVQAALQTFTHRVETLRLGAWAVDLNGLPASEADLAEGLWRVAQAASQLEVRVGVAGGKFTAGQAALSAARSAVVAPDEEAAFLAPLPISTLPHLPGEVVRRLQLFDLHTLGDLAGLRRLAVLRQFGAEFASLHDLAQGRDPRPVQADAPPLRVARSLLLGSVDDRGQLLLAVQRVARQVGQHLNAQGYHAEALQLTLTLDDGQRVEIGGALKPPTSDPTRLMRQAAQWLGRLTVPAPVISVVLNAYPLRSWHLGFYQRALRSGEDQARDDKAGRLQTTLDTLARRFGDAAVRVAALLGPPLPLPIDVTLTRDGQPARYRLGSQLKPILLVLETWREERSWWDQPVRRDYFRVQLADGSQRTIYQDRVSQKWHLARAWPR
jgi:nucleotidyltransferase/DNA polymerase involved in DNA repair